MSRKRHRPQHQKPSPAKHELLRARRQTLLHDRKVPQDLAALVSRDVDLFAKAQVLEECAEYAEAARIYEGLRYRHRDNRLGTEALRALLRVYVQMGSIDGELFPRSTAVHLAQDLVCREPEDSYAHCTLGMLYSSIGEMAAARSEAAVATTLDPDRARPWLDLGYHYLNLGQRQLARQSLEVGTSRKAAASASEARRLAEALIQLGNYDEGWQQYPDARFRLSQEAAGSQARCMTALLGHAVWRGEPTSGRVVLQIDDGFGDCFMYARWIEPARERVGRLVLRTGAPLRDFLAAQFPAAEVIGVAQDPGDFECWTSTTRLPPLFGVRRPDDVASGPYLRATEPFRPLDGAFKVGLRWAGDPHHNQDNLRSIALSAWEVILGLPGVTFYSLQVGSGAEQLLPYADRIHDLAPELTSWSRTAAALMELDLIIAVDTSVAHLAGALGRETWICLAAGPEWRWMLERTDTPWYGSARLFRQPRAGDWSSVFEDVAAALRQVVAARRG